MTENAKPSPRQVLLSRILVVSSILIILALLFLGYIAILQPLLGNPFIPYDACSHEGLEYFDPAVYQDFEKGTLFVEQYESYDFLDSCEVIDFYYLDNKYRDNFLYGIESDVYALTFDAGVSYKSIAETIRSFGAACGTHPFAGEVYEYYLMPSSGLSSDRFVFCIGDTREFLRFILITEIDDEDLVVKTGGGDIISEQIIMEEIFHLSSLDYEMGNAN